MSDNDKRKQMRGRIAEYVEMQALYRIAEAFGIQRLGARFEMRETRDVASPQTGKTLNAEPHKIVYRLMKCQRRLQTARRIRGEEIPKSNGEAERTVLLMMAAERQARAAKVIIMWELEKENWERTVEVIDLFSDDLRIGIDVALKENSRMSSLFDISKEILSR